MQSLTLSSIIESGWNIFKKNIVLIILLVLVVAVPVNAINYFLIDAKFDYEGLSDQLFEIQSSDLNKEDSEYTYNDLLSVTKKYLLWTFLTLLVSSVFLIARCAVVKMALNTYRGIPNDFNSAFETGFTSYPKAFVTIFLMALSVCAGFLFCFVPALIFFYIFFFAEYSVVLSDEWGRKALYNSSLCTRRKPLLCLLTVLLSLLFDFVIVIIFMIITSLVSLGGIWGFIFNTVIVILQQIANVFPACCISVMYITVMDEIRVENGGDGVINDPQYQNHN